MKRYLHYYKCRHCATYAVTAGDGGKYVGCNGCGGAKKYEYRQPVESDHDERTYRLAKERGVLHLPCPSLPMLCVRCGELKTHTRVRPDGDVCRECYQAEEQPPEAGEPEPVKLLTPEECKAVEAERRQATKDYETNHQFQESSE